MVITGSARTAGSAPARVLRLVSVALVVVTAGGFDLLADESPTHLASVLLIAAAVGVLRLVLRARLGRTFALVNLGLLAQPAAHVVSKFAHTGAEWFPHGAALPDDLWSVALQVAVAVLVVLVAGSEPVLQFVAASTIPILRVLVRRLVPADPPLVALAPCPAPRDPIEVLLVRCRPHRGPPTLAGTIGS